MNPIPGAVRTERLLLRAWRPQDALRLLPVLQANVSFLERWIPAHVARPAPLHQLEARLVAFAADVEAGRSWRFAILPHDESDVFGEISLFFRSAAERVSIDAADRVEIGYWLRQDVTGRGYATEAARAMMDLAAGLPGMRRIEIRCDPLNEASAAIPKRLGFRLAQTGAGEALAAADTADQMVWIHEMHSADVG